MKRLLVLSALMLPAPAFAVLDNLVLVYLTGPERVVEGQSATFTATIQNSGVVDVTGTITITLMSSTDNVYSPVNDALVCTVAYTGGVASGQIVNAPVTCTWPVGAAGPYAVAHIDGPPLTDLDNTDNNQPWGPMVVVSQDAPDLVGDFRNAITTVRAGETTSVDVRVRNDGRTSSVATTVTVFLSADTTLGPGDVSLCNAPVGALAYNDHADLTLSNCLVPSTTPLTSGYLIFMVDSGGANIETDERNTVYRAVTIQPPLPDLTIRAFSPPASAIATHTFSIPITLANEGYVSVASAVVTVRASADTTYDGTDTLVCSSNVPAPGAFATVDSVLSGCAVPSTYPVGTSHLVARVDPAGLIDERSNANNDANASFTVIARRPNLQVGALTPPLTAMPGDVVSVDYSLANNGEVGVTLVGLDVRFSADATYDAGDVAMCGGTVPGPDASTLKLGTLANCVIPGSASGGTGYVVARVDNLQLVDETDEGDNDRATAITVEAAPVDTDLPPDTDVWADTDLPPDTDVVIDTTDSGSPHTGVGPGDTDADTDVADSDGIDTDLVDSDTTDTDTVDVPDSDDDTDDSIDGPLQENAPPFWFCSTSGGSPQAAWVALGAAAMLIRRRRARP